MTTLKQQLKKLKLEEVYVPGDGNCQFHSISYVLKAFNIQKSYKKLRKKAINYIKDNKKYYEQFIYDISFKQYIKNLKNGEYGDNLTLDAMANIYDLRIKVLRDKARSNVINSRGTNKVIIIYWGDDGDDAHYNATRKINKCKKIYDDILKKL